MRVSIRARKFSLNNPLTVQYFRLLVLLLFGMNRHPVVNVSPDCSFKVSATLCKAVKSKSYSLCLRRHCYVRVVVTTRDTQCSWISSRIRKIYETGLNKLLVKNLMKILPVESRSDRVFLVPIRIRQQWSADPQPWFKQKKKKQIKKST